METIYFALGFILGAIFGFIVDRASGDELDIENMDDYDD